MGENCEGCNWYRPDDPKIKCLNLDMDGWEALPTERCENYIQKEDYKPAGIWADMAEVVNRLSEKIKENESNG